MKLKALVNVYISALLNSCLIYNRLVLYSNLAFLLFLSCRQGPLSSTAALLFGHRHGGCWLTVDKRVVLRFGASAV